ncbi:MAG: hypothetical protein H6642_03565 [Caldilineaceae bacterium]|nr:hypothetical protein [Caldilineaceae bacterium]
MLPDPDAFVEVEAAVSPALMNEVRDGFMVEDVSILLPKFSFASELKLVKTLSEMGMPDLFTWTVARVAILLRQAVETSHPIQTM